MDEIELVKGQDQEWVMKKMVMAGIWGDLQVNKFEQARMVVTWESPTLRTDRMTD